MKKVIMIATIYGFIKSFEVNNIKILQDLGYEVHTFANETNTSTGSKENVEELENLNIHTHFVPFHRNPFHIDNYRAYKDILDFITKNKDISFIDCHTPVGGVVGRLVAKKSKIKCLYTAHGFHFYKGAPLLNWLIYYPIEKWLSKYTDVLITINREDYNRAKTKFKMKKVEYVPGVGVDVNKFQLENFDRNSYRKSLGLKDSDFAILSVGELNKNKNHEVVIRSVAKLNNNHIHYFIAGVGVLKPYLLNLSEELGLLKQVHLLGFREDIIELDNSVDLYILPSIREGLNVSLMEAIAAGLPCIASNIRGNIDLLEGNESYLFNLEVIDDLKNKIHKMMNTKALENKIIKVPYKQTRFFADTNVKQIMRDLYCIFNDENFICKD